MALPINIHQLITEQIVESERLEFKDEILLLFKNQLNTSQVIPHDKQKYHSLNIRWIRLCIV